MSLRYPRLFNKYGNIIGIHNIFDKEEFEMVDPEGNCILPQFWTQYLQPGWTIEQRFIDNDIFWEGKNPPEQPPYLDLLPAQPTERSVKSSEGKLRNFGKVFKRKY
jgi:hypothetical protein